MKELMEPGPLELLGPMGPLELPLNPMELMGPLDLMEPMERWGRWRPTGVVELSRWPMEPMGADAAEWGRCGR